MSSERDDSGAGGEPQRGIAYYLVLILGGAFALIAGQVGIMGSVGSDRLGEWLATAMGLSLCGSYAVVILVDVLIGRPVNYAAILIAGIILAVAISVGLGWWHEDWGGGIMTGSAVLLNVPIGLMAANIALRLEDFRGEDK